MLPLTKEGKKAYHKQKFRDIRKKEFSYDDKNAIELDITVITLENIEALHIIFIPYDTKYQKQSLLWSIVVLIKMHYLIL